MKHHHVAAACWWVATFALAQTPGPNSLLRDKQNHREENRREARAAVRAALEEKASLPLHPPALPDSATERAREVYVNASRERKTRTEREVAHEVASEQAQESARRLKVESLEGERGAANAERKNHSDTHAAQAQERSDEARGHKHTGHENEQEKPEGSGHK